MPHGEVMIILCLLNPALRERSVARKDLLLILCVLCYRMLRVCLYCLYHLHLMPAPVPLRMHFVPVSLYLNALLVPLLTQA